MSDESTKRAAEFGVNTIVPAASALARMRQAENNGEGIELSAPEVVALITMLRTLSSGVVDDRKATQ